MRLPNPFPPPPGCHFHTRCAIAQKGLCDTQSPVLMAYRVEFSYAGARMHLKSFKEVANVGN